MQLSYHRQAYLCVRVLLNLACMKRRGEFSLHQSNFTSDGQHLAVPRVTSGGSSPQGVPGVGKKADAVADRSSVPLLYTPACLHQGSHARRGNRNGFPGSEVFGTGTLPVGFQGRSALVAPEGAKSRFKKLAHGVRSSFSGKRAAKARSGG